MHYALRDQHSGANHFSLFHQLPEDDLRVDFDTLVECDLTVHDAALEEEFAVILFSDLPQLKLGIIAFLLPAPFTVSNEFRYSLILENRSFRSSLRESASALRSFSWFESFTLFLTDLAVATAAAFPPLKAATPPAVMAAASKTTMLFLTYSVCWVCWLYFGGAKCKRCVRSIHTLG